MGFSRYQPSFAAGVIGPGLRGRTDTEKYDAGLRVGENVFVHPSGGVSNRAGTMFVCEVMDSAKYHRILPFVRDDDESYVLLMGDEKMRLIRDGVLQEDGGAPFETATPFGTLALPKLDYVQSVDSVFFAHWFYFPKRMDRTGEFEWSFRDVRLEPNIQTSDWLDVGDQPAPTNLQAEKWFIDPLYDGTAYTHTYVVSSVVGGVEGFPTSSVSVTTGYGIYPGESEVVLSWQGSADTYRVYRKEGSGFGLIAETSALTITDDGTSFDGGQNPIGVSVVASGTGDETYRYRVAPVIDNVEGYAAPAGEVTGAQAINVQGAENTISWPGTAQEYRVYRERSGVFGYIGFTEDPQFIDDNISPDLSVTPVESPSLFEADYDYPSKVTLFQQRLIFAGSRTQPETLWMSRIGDYENFTKSRILKADDALELDITGAQVNKIRGITQLRELVVLTSGGEYSVTGPNGTLDATSPGQTQHGYSGSADLKPVAVDDTILFVDRTGRQVRDMQYRFEQDGYSGNDLTIFANHFFEKRKITDWAFQKNPYSIIWAAMDDGTVASLTYKREHQVWAWTHHDFGGAVESLCVVREGPLDALYMVVKRTVDGEVKRYVERLHDRDFEAVEDFFGVDCGITYMGPETNTVTGLDHLIGQTVSVLADGRAVTDVSGDQSGAVTLPFYFEKAHIGLPYVSEIETLPAPIELNDIGHSMGRLKNAPEVWVHMSKTAPLMVGMDRGKLSEMRHDVESFSDPVPIYTGFKRTKMIGSWDRDTSLIIQQDKPLPFTILGVAPDISIGRD